MRAFIVGCLLLASCESELGDMISLAIIERQAKEQDVYCYTKDNKDTYCLIYQGKETNE